MIGRRNFAQPPVPHPSFVVVSVSDEGVMLQALTRSALRRDVVTLTTRTFSSSTSRLARAVKSKSGGTTQVSVLATLSNTQQLFKTYKPITPSIRHLRRPLSPHLYEGPPVRALTIAKRKTGGRNNHGHVTVRHRGGGHRRRLRVIDFMRAEPGKQDVVRIEFDPGRSAHIALLKHQNPAAKELWSYILAPEGLRAGDVVESFRGGIPDGLVEGFTDRSWSDVKRASDLAAAAASSAPSANNSSEISPFGSSNPFSNSSLNSSSSENSNDESRQLSIGILRSRVIRPGNVLPLRIVPPGTVIHSLSLSATGRAILVRSAGSFATVVSQDMDSDKGGKYTQVKLQSGEVRHILSSCCATVGRVSNPNWKDRSLGKAGRSRNLGWKPSVRGVAMNAYVQVLFNPSSQSY